MPLLLSKCAGIPILPQNPLELEILSPRPGHDGKLTNQACIHRKLDQCVSWSVREYDLSDPAIRKELGDLNFVCSVAGDFYEICPDKPGFCQITYTGNWLQNLFGQNQQVVKYLPMTPYQAVLDANVQCFNQKAYPFGALK